jgi:hypothetical protein
MSPSRRLLSAAAALLACATLSRPATAQGMRPAAGSPVRLVRLPGRVIVREGRLLRIAGDTVAILGTIGQRADTGRVVLNDTLRLEMPIGVTHKVWQGAVAGIAIGTVAGAIIGAASYKPCDPQEWFCLDFGRGGTALLVGATVGALGAGVGALIGLGTSSPVWGMVDRAGPHALVTRPRGGGIGIGVTLSF